MTAEVFISNDERQRLRLLKTLRGIATPTASAVLFFAEPSRYPIIDRRAVESLGEEPRNAYGYAYWVQYIDWCRTAADDLGVSIRTLDKALWQRSKESAA